MGHERVAETIKDGENTLVGGELRGEAGDELFAPFPAPEKFDDGALETARLDTFEAGGGGIEIESLGKVFELFEAADGNSATE